MHMNGLLPALRWLPPIVFAALLMILTACQAPGEQGTPVPAAVNAPQEATVSPTAPRSATVTAAPVPTVAQPSVSPSASRPLALLTGTAAVFRRTDEASSTGTAELPAESATTTPASALPVAPVTGARAPDFSLTNLNGDEVSLGDLRGQAVLLNFWATW